MALLLRRGSSFGSNIEMSVFRRGGGSFIHCADEHELLAHPTGMYISLGSLGSTWIQLQERQDHAELA